VLRDLKPWTIAINDVFIHAGTDRQSKFVLVSQVPMETQSDVALSELRDHGQNFPVVYNHEIREIQNTQRYKLVGEPDQFSPKQPGRFDPRPCFDVAGKWSGNLTVTDVRGESKISPGQRRKAAVTLEQTGCRVRLKFASNEIAGYLISQTGPSLVTAVLDEVIAGSVERAELTIPPSGPLQLELDQRAATASIISVGRLTR
jgi:hypothetical protein